MAAGPTGTLARHFSVYGDDGGTTPRGTCIINPEGVLVGSGVNAYNA